MQDDAVVADGDGKGISRANSKDDEHRISSGGYKTKGRKKGMTIPNNPDCLSRFWGAECGNNAKGKSVGVVGVIQQQQDHGRRCVGGQWRSMGAWVGQST